MKEVIQRRQGRIIVDEEDWLKLMQGESGTLLTVLGDITVIKIERDEELKRVTFYGVSRHFELCESQRFPLYTWHLAESGDASFVPVCNANEVRCSFKAVYDAVSVLLSPKLQAA